MNMYELLELAEAVLDLPEGSDDDVIEDAMYKKFETGLDQFGAIAEALVKFTPTVRTAVTDTPCQGFVKDDCFIVQERL